MKNNQLRNFAIASAVFLTVVLLGIFYYVNEQLRSEIEKAGEVSNATLTRVFVNETWTEISTLLPPLTKNLDEIRANPNIKKIDSRMRRFMSYTDVLKVKLYNINGITTYSSDFDQIGEDKADNKGFQQALRGKLASELIYRGKFGAFDGQLYNRNLVSTYAPIRDGAQVIAVAEIYSDRTSSIAQAIKLRNELLISLIISLVFLYLIMMLAARKIYLNMRSLGAEQTSVHSKISSATGLDNSDASQDPSHLPLYPIPELSLRGLGDLIQRLGSFSAARAQLESTNGNEQLLSSFSKEASAIATQITKYRMLQSYLTPARQDEINLLHFDRMVEFLNKYANAIDAIETIQFYQGQKYPNGFVQSQNTIESILTGFIDLISCSYATSTIEIKFNGTNECLDIDLISSSISPVNPRYSQLFYELDYMISALARMLQFKYKATISDKGILVSLSFTQLKKNPLL